MSAHCGCPSAIMKETTRIRFDRDTSSSCSAPKVRTEVTCAPTNFLNIPGQRRSRLQLPPKMDLGFSILQLHSIISDTSPSGLPGVPSRKVVGVNLPNSTNSAEPYPRQTCETG